MDPGTTTGVSILDLDGELLASTSKKEFSQDAVIRFIISNGTPLIVATDVTPPPSTVEKLASTLGAEIYHPDNDLATDEKEALVTDFDTVAIDIHAQDALAAAVKAYNHHKHFLDRVRRQAGEADVEDVEAVIKKSLHSPRSIQQAIADVRPDETESEEPVQSPAPQVDWEEKAEEYREQLKRREQENRRLRNYVEELKDDMQELEEEKERLETRRGKEIQKQEEVQRWKRKAENSRKQARNLERDRESLRSQVDSYQRLIDALHSGSDLFRICSSGDELDRVTGEVAFVGRNVHEEVPSNVTTVVVEKAGDAEFYADKGLHTAHMGAIEGRMAGDFYAADTEAIKEHVKTDEDKFMDWLDEYRERND